ncbi:hypothetical protein F4806DRAFT_153753 [Annulohypoxylon nitens]|nr:hypothetical protein F4806DRAFT_153753 [Annulohypoxylon nitens]
MLQYWYTSKVWCVQVYSTSHMAMREEPYNAGTSPILYCRLRVSRCRDPICQWVSVWYRAVQSRTTQLTAITARHETADMARELGDARTKTKCLLSCPKRRRANIGHDLLRLPLYRSSLCEPVNEESADRNPGDLQPYCLTIPSRNHQSTIYHLPSPYLGIRRDDWHILEVLTKSLRDPEAPRRHCTARICQFSKMENGPNSLTRSHYNSIFHDRPLANSCPMQAHDPTHQELYIIQGYLPPTLH